MFGKAVWVVNGEEVARTNAVRGVEVGRVYRPNGIPIRVDRVGDEGMPDKPSWIGDDVNVYGTVVE